MFSLESSGSTQEACDKIEISPISYMTTIPAVNLGETGSSDPHYKESAFNKYTVMVLISFLSLPWPTQYGLEWVPAWSVAKQVIPVLAGAGSI